MPRVHWGWEDGWRWVGATVVALLLLLASLDRAVGLGPPAGAVATAAQLAILALLGRGLAGTGRGRLGAANTVTVTRSVLACGVAALATQTLSTPVPPWSVVAVAAPALALDLVDGWVARRTASVTGLGARFDMETDAFLILALSVYVGHQVGWWVLVSGLARYLMGGAQALWPALRRPVAARRWRKVVAAIQGSVLVVAASALLPGWLTGALLVLGVGLLVISFATEVHERLAGPAPAGAPGVVVSVLALALLWAALAAPNGDRHLSPWLLVRVPLELALLVVAAVVLRARAADRLALVVGGLTGVLLALKAVNVGFTLVLDRRFDVLGDWFYLGAAIGVLGDSVGRPAALALVAVLAVVLVGLLALVPLAALRVARLARLAPRWWVSAAAALTVVGLVLNGLGVGPRPYHRSLSTDTMGVAVDEVADVRADLRDRTVFADQIAADPVAHGGPTGLLDRLRGKDVLLVFVESYGRAAVEDSAMAPGVGSVLDRGTRQLRQAGYAARSAFLTSPTFGAGSWLAHSTLQSGLWVDSQRRYSQLLGSRRLTLSRAFREEGWRTVFVVPSVTRPWGEGRRFYGFDRLYDAGNVGYRGPAFGYATMPDQYTLARFRAAELTSGPRPPVMAEIDLVSSHHPWAPLPKLVPWSQVGDGSVFAGMPERGRTAEEVLGTPELVRRAYAQSVEYSLAALVSFLATYPDDDLVVLMLGDHQPHRLVSGGSPGYDVPVSLIARDPAVLAAVADWHWSEGLRPPTAAPVWRMDAVRDRFLTAFTSAAPPVEPQPVSRRLPAEAPASTRTGAEAVR